MIPGSGSLAGLSLALVAAMVPAVRSEEIFPLEDGSSPLVEGLIVRQTVHASRSMTMDRTRLEAMCRALGTPLALSPSDAELDGTSAMTSYYHDNRVAHYNAGHALVARNGVCHPQLIAIRTGIFVTRSPQGEDLVEVDFERHTGRRRHVAAVGSVPQTPGLARVVGDLRQHAGDGPPGWTAAGQARVAGDHPCKLWVLDTPKLHSQTCRVLPPAFPTPFADLAIAEWFDHPAGRPGEWIGGKFDFLDWKAKFRSNVLDVPSGMKITEVASPPIPGNGGSNAGKIP